MCLFLGGGSVTPKPQNHVCAHHQKDDLHSLHWQKCELRTTSLMESEFDLQYY